MERVSENARLVSGEGIPGSTHDLNNAMTDGLQIQNWPDGDRSGIAPELAGVSETMLWSLHNRASEAKRADGVLADPGSVRIHDSIDYDFTRHFGAPLGSLAARAAEIDRALRTWLKGHPDGIVISLGEGLETQGQRVDNGRMHWLSVDLPAAIRLREQFLAPTLRFRHIAASVLDPVWMEAVDPTADVFIVAQGLLMYLEPDSVRQIFIRIADRFPGARIVFDTVPCWFSQLTLVGLNQTPHYRLPPMPWGIDRDDIGPTLRRWHPRVADVAFLSHRMPRGPARLMEDMTSHIPVARHRVPSLVLVTIEDRRQQPAAKAMRDGLTVPGRARMHEGFTVTGQGAMPGSGMVEIFSTVAITMLEQTEDVSRRMIRLASDEMMTIAHATLEMSRCSSFAPLAEAQGRFAHACFNRATSRFIAMGLQALTTQAAAMAPMRRTVAATAAALPTSVARV
jgi:hypothetical protein